MNRGTVIIFAKAPRAGAVKTRLGVDIGAGRATALFRIMTKWTIREAQKSGHDLVIAVDPHSAITGWGNIWPGDVSRIPQGRGDLGMRMARMFSQAPAGPVVIIGADAPSLRARHLREAMKALQGADAVFGPASDGGYWLIGLARRRMAPTLFANVRWSSKHALSDTIASLPDDFAIKHLEELRDVDTADDLQEIGAFSTARG